jgi:hypothetical protein
VVFVGQKRPQERKRCWWASRSPRPSPVNTDATRASLDRSTCDGWPGSVTTQLACSSPFRVGTDRQTQEARVKETLVNGGGGWRRRCRRRGRGWPGCGSAR